MTEPLHESDKAFWHRYLDVYERAFATLGRVSTILEFGVFKGDSIRWLLGRFPDAQVLGCDIVAQQPSWPVSPRVGYARLDQGAVEQLRRLFAHFKVQFDLVIEDGSHEPVHQRNCLVETLPHVRPGGMYILEDIQTSHPSHALYQKLRRPTVVGPLHLLLALEHLRARGAGVDEATLVRLTEDSLFSRDDVEKIAARVSGIELYKRATLPLRCYACGTSNFDFAALRCACGTRLFEDADSMTAVIRL
jgi:hypothetical protein